MKLICRMGDETKEIEVAREGSGYRVIVGGKPHVVDLATANGILHSLQFDDGRQYLFAYHRDGSRHEVAFSDRTVTIELFDPLSMKRRRLEDDSDETSHVRAIMPGRVTRVHVAPGDVVRRGQGLLILEAMKMENEIVSPRDGVVAALLVSAGQAVENGDELVSLE
ncbi:MAG: biotin/lipoyl-containing protein [Thermoanaerobaculia bacterium]